MGIERLGYECTCRLLSTSPDTGAPKGCVTSATALARPGLELVIDLTTFHDIFNLHHSMRGLFPSRDNGCSSIMFKHSQEIKHQYQIIMMQYVVMNTR